MSKNPKTNHPSTEIAEFGGLEQLSGIEIWCCVHQGLQAIVATVRSVVENGDGGGGWYIRLEAPGFRCGSQIPNLPGPR